MKRVFSLAERQSCCTSVHCLSEELRVWERDFIRDKRQLRNLAQCAFVWNTFWPRKGMQNRFVFAAGDRADKSTVWAAKVLSLFRLNTRAKSSTIEIFLLQYIEYTRSFNEMNKNSRYMCLRKPTTDEEVSNAIAEKELKIDRYKIVCTVRSRFI